MAVNSVRPEGNYFTDVAIKYMLLGGINAVLVKSSLDYILNVYIEMYRIGHKSLAKPYHQIFLQRNSNSMDDWS